VDQIPALQLWGGAECTINRVGDQYFDQFARSRHLQRSTDLERFASLGLRTLRFGLHWERYAAMESWHWFDERLASLRSLGIEPIAGLLHHGSGPPQTSLLDPGFPAKLAAYAGQVARRYPWVRLWTPVNEPQTTARFSGLYGHWYPHHRSLESFIRALYHQLKGTVLAMRAIREVRPDALLIQTEDAGRTAGTSPLAGIVQHREQRRWLPFDLLAGLVERQHPLFGYLRRHGLSEAEILWFADNPCAADVLGLNYYVTSDRFLDHRLGLYPEYLAGGDTAREPYVDIEAVRVLPEGIAGSAAILTEAWRRYRRPVAITEAHLGASADEQIRWLVEIWRGAQAARASGVDCRAVCVWALLGSYDWCHLVTCDRGAYEPGVFDVRRGDVPPRETDLAQVVRQLAAGGEPDHPALAEPGWWARAERILFPREEEVASAA
jgi:dTDP-4-dehydrorhamnose reductase